MNPGRCTRTWGGIIFVGWVLVRSYARCLSVSAVLASEEGDTLALAPSCTESNPKEYRLVGFETGILANGEETNMRIDALGDLIFKHVSL